MEKNLKNSMGERYIYAVNGSIFVEMKEVIEFFENELLQCIMFSLDSIADHTNQRCADLKSKQRIQLMSHTIRIREEAGLGEEMLLNDMRLGFIMRKRSTIFQVRFESVH